MFKELLTEDRGVSPVIGVILMVAITVILAAVIGAFVLGLGDQVASSTPQASFEYDFEGDKNVTITHGGGDDIDQSTISVTLSGESLFADSTVDSTTVNNSSVGWEDPISTGDSIEFEPNQSAVETNGQTVRVIWNNPSGGSSNTIGEREWPN